MEQELSEEEIKLVEQYITYFKDLKDRPSDKPSVEPVASNAQTALHSGLKKLYLRVKPNGATSDFGEPYKSWLYIVVQENVDVFTEAFKLYKDQIAAKSIDKIFDKQLTAMTGWEFQQYLKSLGLVEKLRERTK